MGRRYKAQVADTALSTNLTFVFLPSLSNFHFQTLSATPYCIGFIYMYIISYQNFSHFFIPPSTCSNLQLWIEFYLLVSHSCMKDRGYMYKHDKFRNAQSAFRNLHMDPLSFITL